MTRITILYDNEAKKGYRSGWGFSCLVDIEKKILFDTGWDGGALLENMVRAGVKKEDIDALVLSHDHWDHIGGVPPVLHPDLQVYVPGSFSRRLKAEISSRSTVHECNGPAEIIKGIFVTGPLGSVTKEQSMAVGTKSGLLVITGCAHPGLDKIMEAAGKLGRVSGVVGGFHDLTRLELLEGLDLIMPCHCTTMKGEILNRFPEISLPCRAGLVLELDGPQGP